MNNMKDTLDKATKAITDIYIAGYEQGHNDTVESNYGHQEEHAEEYINENKSAQQVIDIVMEQEVDCPFNNSAVHDYFQKYKFKPCPQCNNTGKVKLKEIVG